MHEKNRKVERALLDAGIEPRIRILTDPTPTAAHAAATIGCEVAAIGNSLIFDCDGSALLVITSGAHRVDTQLLAEQIGAQTIRRASPDLVRSATGQVIGGVAPVGHPTRLRTLVDETLASFDPVWTAAGTADSVMAITFGDLVRVTGGSIVRVN